MAFLPCNGIGERDDFRAKTAFRLSLLKANYGSSACTQHQQRRLETDFKNLQSAVARR